MSIVKKIILQTEFDGKSAEKGIEKVGKQTDKTSSKFQGLNKVSQELQSQLENTFGIPITQIKGYVSGLGSASKAITGTTKSVGFLSKSFKLLKVAIAATGIGALLIAFGGLVSYLTRTQKGIELVNNVMAGLRAAFDVILDRMIIFARGFKEIFIDLDPAKGFDTLKQAVSGLGEELKEETQLAFNLRNELQQLDKEQANLEVRRAKQRAQIEELKKQSEDQTQTEKVRLKAAEQAFEMEQKLLAEQLEAQQRRVDILKQINDLASSTEEDIQLVRDAEIELANLQEESFTKQTELQNKVNAIRKEGADLAIKQGEEQAKIEEERQKLIQATENIRVESQLRDIDNAEELAQRKLVLAFQAQKKEIEAIEGFQAQKAELITELEIKLQSDLSDVRLAAQEDRLKREMQANLELRAFRIDQLDKESQEYINKQTELLENQRNNLLENEELTESERLLIVEKYQAMIDAVKDEALDKEKQRNDQELKWFEMTWKQKAEKVGNYVGQFGGQISGLWSEINQIQANADQRQLQSLRERLDAEVISQEQYDQKVKQIQIEQARRERNLAIFQATINTFTGFTKALQQKGALGFVTGALVLATGLAKVAAIKSQPLPEYGDGGLIQGKSHSKGGVDINAEGDEYVLKKGVYQKYPSAVESLNNGNFETYLRNQADPSRHRKTIERKEKRKREMRRKRGENGMVVKNYKQLGQEIGKNISGTGYTKKR